MTDTLDALAVESAALDSAPDFDAGNLCPVCSLPIEKPKRGRPPKMHPECRKQSSGADKNSSAPRKSAGSWPAAAAVENALNQLFEYGSLGLMLVNPEDGQIVAKGGPAVSKALVDLGRTDKKLRRYLEMLASPGKYGPLTMSLLAIVIPVMANHNLIPQISLFSETANTTERSEP